MITTWVYVLDEKMSKFTTVDDFLDKLRAGFDKIPEEFQPHFYMEVENEFGDDRRNIWMGYEKPESPEDVIKREEEERLYVENLHTSNLEYFIQELKNYEESNPGTIKSVKKALKL